MRGIGFGSFGGLGAGSIRSASGQLRFFANGGMLLNAAKDALNFEDSAETTPAGAGDPVGGVLPDGSSPAALRFTSATTARPLRGRNPKTGVRNLLDYSQDFSNAAWVKVSIGTGVNPVVTANTAEAPDGTMTADRIDFERATTTAGDRSSISSSGVSVTSAVQYYGSLWIKAASPSDVGRELQFRHVSAGSPQRIAVSADWQRVGRVETGFPTGSRPMEFGFITIGGETTLSVLAWGAQVSLGADEQPYQNRISENDITEAGVPDVWFYRPDGTDDNLIGNAAASAIFQNCDVGYFACIVEHASLNGEYIASWSTGDNGTNQRLGLKASSTGELIAEVRRADADTTASTTSTAGDIVTGTKQFVMVVVNWTAGTVALYVDDAVTAAATGSTPAGAGASANTASQACRLMSQSDDTDYLDGQLWGYILAGRTNPSLADRQFIKRQLEKAAGL